MHQILRTLAACFLCCMAFSCIEASSKTRTPIKHLIVIFQENRTFDHYFGTYPNAQNKKGEPKFVARKGTPSVNGLTFALTHRNQNLAQPFRLSPAQVNTCNPDHKYTTLQQACHAGLMDMFVQTNGKNCISPIIVMGYFDGNTVTALWNYAQHFSMSDNYHATHIGASTVGAINLVSGQVHGATPDPLSVGTLPVVASGTIINDVDPKFDKCSVQPTVELSGKNIGNLLNKKKITWGWFQGGFRDCTATHIGPGGKVVVDYVMHHNPFQYYRSTSNPFHKPPRSPKTIGKKDRANHLYDVRDFWAAIKVGNLPDVSFLKAAAYQNGHAGNSDPLLEQQFLVRTVNKLQKLPQWKDMAIIIAYDDSGGWYDHEVPPIINQSQIFADAFVAPGSAGSNPPFGGYEGRPSYGYRLPFLVISPWAKENYVDHHLIDQTSILKFIEDNWDLGRIGNFSFDSLAGSISPLFDFTKHRDRNLELVPKTGEVRR